MAFTYIRNLDRLFGKDYLPTDEDILHSRRLISGLGKTVFSLDRYDFHIHDIGGTRSYRKKWIHSFGGLHHLIFITALSGYDQCLVEDKTGVCVLSINYPNAMI